MRCVTLSLFRLQTDMQFGIFPLDLSKYKLNLYLYKQMPPRLELIADCGNDDHSFAEYLTETSESQDPHLDVLYWGRIVTYNNL